MATQLATLVSPGPFKAKKKDPEKMLADFELYMKSFADFLVVTDNSDAADNKKKSLLRAIGGQDMIFLFDHLGKVTEEMTYAVAIQNVRTAITSQTNQAMIRYKLFTNMAQENEAFSSWWAKIKEQAEKCNFEGYDSKSAARDAILFQTSDVKLRKKVLAEDYGLDETIKLGLAHEQSEAKAAIMENKDDKSNDVRKIVEEEVARLNTDRSVKLKCQTCTGFHKSGFKCPGKKCEKCFSCGEKGHFKGAPLCKGKTVNKNDSKQRDKNKENKKK